MVKVIKIVLLVAAWCPVILNLPDRHPGLVPHVDPKAVASIIQGILDSFRQVL
jgi:hypothetical protein